MMLTRIVRGVIAAAQVVGIDPAVAVDRQIGHPCAQALEEAAGREDRRMLDPGGDDVIALVPVARRTRP